MDPKDQDTTPAAPGIPTENVTLDTPLHRGKQTVTEVSVRKPLSGALRGVALVDLLNMDTQSLHKVLPRITEPALTEAELRQMDPADLVQLGSKVSRFLLGKRADGESDA
ncbi:phage tail assembly protein [Billgrantia gudaonensis]|uniref:Phage tail assembly chaperone protein, E, or 41 or 14 n=1 Tax=Billgrantia gudaonensis TaxID=376427 RepID=A0A1G8XCV6_9GAMM|nr:phage tail assembly protein [Halomonas gudaonensis]SDJ88301.1 Phage tail assembly chaperone protein, E, or 41 or 14 [Halomonas gudaonensis]